MSIQKKNKEDWIIEYDFYAPDDEGRREAVLALGNGYMVSRAVAPEAESNHIHYPGTYRAGCYNRLTTLIEGWEVENESLVNLPNWLSLSFRIKGERWFSIDEVEILSYRQKLDLKQAVLYRKIQFCDSLGRKTLLRERRFLSMAQPHLMALEMELTSENWSGEIEIRSALDGNVRNGNVARYAPFNNRHLKTLFTRRKGEDRIELKARTLQSEIEIVLAARTRVYTNGIKVNASRQVNAGSEKIEECLHLEVKKGGQVLVEKVASLYTSRDSAIGDCSEAANKSLERAPSFAEMFAAHTIHWKQLWRRCHLEMGNKEQLKFLRLHMFQIIQNISPHTAEEDVGVPPSGWQGEEYHGQIFWDELFIFPFLSFRFPTIARSLLLYRYRRLGEARQLAKRHGYRGAMFPWRSASTGREETPSLQLNLLSGHWMEDRTCLQHHIGTIIVFNVCHYLQLTNDQIFLAEYGAELVLEIARFWASKAHYNPELDRYEIHGIVGPDEYHTQYPSQGKGDTDRQGIDNNSYTNLMVAWTLRQALYVWEQLMPEFRQELSEKFSFSKEELALWKEMSRKMRIVFQEDGTISQFEGYTSLLPFDLAQFREEYGQERIDWTLEARGDRVERYQVSKQADAPLMLYLFSPEELIEMLKYLGYAVDKDTLKRTLNFDLAHAAHESSLSRIVYAAAFAKLDPEASWAIFREAQLIDSVPEKDKGTTEGIHIGAMGGSLHILQHHYLGIKIKAEELLIDPAFPPGLKWVEVALYFRGIRIVCKGNPSCISLRSVNDKAGPVKVRFRSHCRKLSGGQTITLEVNEGK